VTTSSGRPARNRAPWTPQDIATLRQRRAERVKVAVIAEELGRTQRSVYLMMQRLRYAERPEFRCSHCQQVKAAEEFVPSMRFLGGWCRTCRRSREPRMQGGSEPAAAVPMSSRGEPAPAVE
jgi:hypothetical protein